MKFLIFLLLFCGSLSAQTGVYLTAGLGAGINSDFNLNERAVSRSRALVGEAALSFRFRLCGAVYAETGLGARVLAAGGRTDDRAYRSQTLRMVIPLLFGGNISEKSRLYLGTTVRNNLDFVDIDLQQKYFLRSDAVLKADRQLTDRWQLFSRVSYGVYGVKNSYLLIDPRFSILLGAAYRL